MRYQIHITSLLLGCTLLAGSHAAASNYPGCFSPTYSYSSGSRPAIALPGYTEYQCVSPTRGYPSGCNSVTGCPGARMKSPVGDKTAAATLIGTVAGGLIGTQFGHHGGRFVGAAIGALIGGFIGNGVGAQIDEGDVLAANSAFATATRVPIGSTIYWNNARTGNWGYYRPIKDGHRRFDGLFCREFVTRATINGRVERVSGVACRRPNGSWEAM